ncbi:L,D-transpeptidase family protein [Planctomicrobium sp. SH527]|uniref:L,D-transpeptidase n=1 Tax=Planctomicrobium sp. SH527 TaxID=3448123 RepID=UPI003F5C149D
MFDQRPRRHPVQTFQFWFIVLCSFGIVTAWKLDFFTSGSSVSPTVGNVEEEPMPPPPRALANREIVRQAEPAPAQSESNDSVVVLEGTVEPTTSEDVSQLEKATAQEPMEAPAGDAAPAIGQTAIVQTAFVRQAPAERAVNAVRSSEMYSSSSSESGVVTADAIDDTSDDHGQVVPKPHVRSVAKPEGVTGEVRLEEADRLAQEGRDVEALRLYSKWYWTQPDQRSKFFDRMNLLAGKIYFQPQQHYLEPYVMQFGDRFEQIAARYQLSPQYLARLNRIDASQLRTGHALKVLQGPFSAVIDLSDMDLTVHSNGYYLVRMKVGFGANATIEQGSFKVVEKIVNPPFRSIEGSVAGGDPENPLGTRLLTLKDHQGEKIDLGIHGTNEPDMIGQTGSHGCIRLKNREMEALFDLVVVGSEVVVKQ